MDTIAAAFESAQIGQPVRFENLAMVPLLREQQGDRAYITLDEALEAGTDRVSDKQVHACRQSHGTGYSRPPARRRPLATRGSPGPR